MKRIFLAFAAIVCAASSVAYGQTNRDEQSVRQTLSELAAAINSQDMAKLDGFYAANYVLINPTGARINKTERLATVKNDKPNSGFAYENVKIRFYGDTAIVNANVKTSAAQDPLTNQTTLVLIRKGRSWQLVSAHGTTVAGATGSNGAEQAVRQTLTDLMNALNRGDAEAVGRFYADDYQIVMENGTIVTKSQRLDGMKSGALKFQSIAFENVRVRQYGSTAIATYQVKGRSTALGSDQDVNSLATVMLINSGGRWQIVSSHLTKVGAN